MDNRLPSPYSLSQRPPHLGLELFRSAGSSFVACKKQAARLQERRAADPIRVSVCGVGFEVFRGVYDTGVDTELMIDSVAIGRNERFLEIGCGAGAISILLAQRSKEGMGVDINTTAVVNSQHNARLLGVENVSFAESDVFQAVNKRFHVIVCNPPYNCYPARDVVDQMFWDPSNRMKQRFFRGVHSHLTLGGRIYFGWADFDDIERDFPVRLANSYGFVLTGMKQRSSRSGRYRFLVLEFQRRSRLLTASE